MGEYDEQEESAASRPSQHPLERNRAGHLIGSAAAWGGNPDKEAFYLNVAPPRNDGRTIHKLIVKDVLVDGFWSVSLYNAEGYFQKNDRDAYSLNNITANKNADGSITIQFGGCDGKVPNCLRS